jgi:membrane-bound lytic murein transglycosylase D
VVVDQASVIIAEATDLYLLGEEAYRAGNMERARRQFDAAVLRFLNSGQVIAENPRLQTAFDRILGDIRSLESEALADQEDSPDRSEPPMEGIRDITEFLSPDELAAEKERVGKPESIDGVEAFSIPVVLNDQVLTFIEAFENTPRFRKAFRGGYQRMGRYEPMIRRILREEGLPEDLIYLAFIESTFKTNAYSRARAKGMWQFMASTGSRYGLVRNYYVDDRSDPEKATRAAAKYLKELHGMFGDWYLAMAGYNAGEMKVVRAIRRTGKKDFWALARTRHLMRETKNFVPSILALSVMSRDPARYGHEGLKKDPPLEYDWVAVDGPTEIALVAKLTGASTRSIQELNPQLRRSVTPPGVRSYKVRVPRGKGDAFQRAYSAMPDSEKIASVMVRYRVRRGDTLGRIARKHGTTVAALAQANGIRSRSRIYAGSTLLVPRGSGGSASEWHRSSGWAGALAGPDGIYTVRRGDTLSAIAIRHGTTVSRLTSLNRISARSILRPGQTLRVRHPSDAAVADGPAHGYKVRRGDTLSTIARRHGTTIARIEAMNGISRHSILYPGQQLRIPRRAGGDTAPEATKGSRHVRYTVRRGDSLYAIATSHGTTVERLRSWNKMGRRSRIYPGEVLDIFIN